MEVFECIRHRRTVRYFIDKEISDKDLEIILDAGRWAPSDLNCQPLEFIVVKDDAKKKLIHDGMLHGWEVEEGCFDGFGCYAGTQEYPTTQNLPRQDEFTPMDYYHPPVMVIVASDEEKRETTQYTSNEYFSVSSNAAGAAIMNMMLAARSLGIGSVWLTFPDSVELKWQFGIPKTMGIAGIVNLGYPDRWSEVPDVIGADDPRYWPKRPLESMLHYEKFDEDRWQNNTRSVFMYGPVVGKDRYLEKLIKESK
ncbi:MAG: hypothetical protein GX076_06930 [Clostridiales bacterium]|nr:hypothetical protein [Clostridiales bacterium]